MKISITFDPQLYEQLREFSYGLPHHLHTILPKHGESPEKLDALKTHKKALMQQLFPAAEGD